MCLATGRSYKETLPIWRRLSWQPPFEPIVLIGGALVCEPDTGRTLYQRTIPLDLACEFADALGEAGYSAMAIVDAWRHGWDYVLCETGDAHAAQRDWFEKMQAKVRRVRRLAEMPDMPNPLRINVVVDPDAADELVAAMNERFGDRLNIHAIVAPNYEVTIVEGFAKEADKWNALRYVAQGCRIGPGQIAAVGDDVNDLTMVRRAGLGVAMPQAAPAVLAAADHVATGGLAGVGLLIRSLARELRLDEDRVVVASGLTDRAHDLPIVDEQGRRRRELEPLTGAAVLEYHR